ncbi:hypothetical protein HDU98_005032 [Podochytrium sp. JEL0797]|nr:hypothetical protein HDU98_005032 [Podochytrium sp. JEL0797]
MFDEEQVDVEIDHFDLTDAAASEQNVTIALKQDKKMHLLLELMNVTKTIEGDADIRWIVEKTRTADDIISDIKFIRHFIEEPMDSSNKPLTKMIRKKPKKRVPKKKAVAEESDDDEQEDKLVRRKKVEKAPQVFLSKQFIEDSDDDDDAAFFEAERQIRLKSAAAAGAVAASGGGTVKPKPTKKVEKPAPVVEKRVNSLSASESEASASDSDSGDVREVGKKGGKVDAPKSKRAGKMQKRSKVVSRSSMFSDDDSEDGRESEKGVGSGEEEDKKRQKVAGESKPKRVTKMQKRSQGVSRSSMFSDDDSEDAQESDKGAGSEKEARKIQKVVAAVEEKPKRVAKTRSSIFSDDDSDDAGSGEEDAKSGIALKRKVVSLDLTEDEDKMVVTTREEVDPESMMDVGVASGVNSPMKEAGEQPTKRVRKNLIFDSDSE